jgi:glucokinase
VTGLVGALEIGGTHVSAARVDVGKSHLEPTSLRRFSLDPRDSLQDALGTIVSAAMDVALPATARWGVATPGPFDYERGVSLIRGLGKLDALYGADLKARLAEDLGLARPEQVRFLNDAHAFVLGEWWAGGARGHARAMGVTLGTGLGSGFLADGELVASGPLVPPEGRVDLVPFRGRAVEDSLSSRGIAAAFGGAGEVIDIARRAREGEPAARAAFTAFGSGLAEFLDPWIIRFAPTCLVFGGGVAHAWDLFGGAFVEASLAATILDRCSPADRLTEAPLLGAALYTSRSQSEAS